VKHELQFVIYGFVAGAVPSAHDFAVSRLKVLPGMINNDMANLAKADWPSPVDRQEFATVVRTWHIFYADFMTELASHNTNVVVQARINGEGPASTNAVMDLVQSLSVEAQQVDHHSGTVYSQARLMLLLTLIVAVLLGVVLALAISTRMVRPLRKTVRVLEGVASGDLTQRLDVQSADEVGQMAKALNSTLSTVSDVIRMLDSEAAKLAELASAEEDGAQESVSRSAELASMAGNLNAMTSVFQTEAAEATSA
jgi:methyl-accepting chemotaxis protein